MTNFTRETTASEVVKAFGDQVKGKIIAITGPSAKSLGAEMVTTLAQASPAQFLLIGRTESKISPVAEAIAKIDNSIKNQFFQCDLSDLASVRSAAGKINEYTPKIDILINCAGVMAIPEYTKSVDGIEMQFAANHVGHFLLTNLLMDKIKAAGPGARIVNLTSTGFALQNFREDWNFSDGATYNAWRGYGQAKSADVLFTRALSEKLHKKGVEAFVTHPGVILTTGIMSHASEDTWALAAQVAKEQEEAGEPGPQPMEEGKTVPQGASTTLVAALDPSIADKSGAFLKDCHVQPPEVLNGYLKDSANAQRLWEVSEKIVGESFNP